MLSKSPNSKYRLINKLPNHPFTKFLHDPFAKFFGIHQLIIYLNLPCYQSFHQFSTAGNGLLIASQPLAIYPWRTDSDL